MGVRIITDNVADLPQHIIERHRLHVVPLGVHFGEEAGAERMDADEFYARLVESDPLPTTAAPNPEEYVEAYREIIDAGDDAVVVTISAKLSATFEVARRAVALANAEGRVSVVDSTMATIAEGFVAVRAAMAAATGSDRSEVVTAAHAAIPHIGFVAAFDTLEYLRRGGRIGAARALLGSVLKIHPLVTLTDGIVSPYGRARSRSQAIQALVDYAASFRQVETLAIEHTACADDAARLREVLAGKYPGVEIYESRATPVIGTHTGPGLLVLSLYGERS